MFKVGDKVRFIGDYHNHNVTNHKGENLKEVIRKNNNILTINSVSNLGSIFEVKEDRFWCFSKEELELIENQFTKSDLQDGDIVTYRNGNQRTLKGNILIDKEGFRTGTIKSYNDNLQHINVKENDIIEVERPVKYETVFERKEEILDEVEKEYLRNVIRPFRDKIIAITKESNYDSTEYLAIRLEESSGYFPDFKENTMYKNMELDKQYTLEELGL